MLRITLVLLSLLYLGACQGTHRVVVINDTIQRRPVKQPKSDTAHSVFGFINWSDGSYESNMCVGSTWAKVASEQGPLWSGLRVGANAGNLVNLAAGTSIPFGLMNVYSQIDTEWYCARTRKTARRPGKRR